MGNRAAVIGSKVETMSQTLTYTEVLHCSAEEMWEACKHADTILPDLMPELFAKSELLQGHGEPGSIRVITMGSGMYAIHSAHLTSSFLVHSSSPIPSAGIN